MTRESVLVDNPNDYYIFTSDFTIDSVDTDDFYATLIVSDNDDPSCANDCDRPFTNDNFAVYVESHDITIHLDELPAHTADRVRALRA